MTFLWHLLQKEAVKDFFPASRGSIRENAVKPGGTEKWKVISPRYILLLFL